MSIEVKPFPNSCDFVCIEKRCAMERGQPLCLCGFQRFLIRTTCSPLVRDTPSAEALRRDARAFRDLPQRLQFGVQFARFCDVDRVIFAWCSASGCLRVFHCVPPNKSNLISLLFPGATVAHAENTVLVRLVPSRPRVPSCCDVDQPGVRVDHVPAGKPIRR